MREIIFRGIRVDNNKWVYGYYFKTPLTDESTGSSSEQGWFFLTGRERHCISHDGCVYQVIASTVGQYIGRQDINNKDIYEGDIIDNEMNSQGIVEFFTNLNWDGGGSIHSGFYIKEWFEYKDECCLSYHDGFDECEIIGNKHENPELLEV